MRFMTIDTIGQSLLFKMPPIYGDCRMAAETVVKLEQGSAMRLVARVTFKLHCAMLWKSLSLQRHGGMAARASFLLWF